MHEEHAVTRQGTHDDLLMRIAAADPAAEVAPLSEGALSRIVRHAMTPTPRVWSRGRFRLASFGAIVGSGGLVLAAVLGIEAASPSLPVLAIGKIPQSSVATALRIPASPTATSNADFAFASVYGLGSVPKSTTTYRLVSRVSAAAAASELAGAFHVRGHVVSLQRGSYRVGRSRGPSITTWTSEGVVEWSYRSVSGTGAPVSVPAVFSLPNATEATNDALTLLSRLGVRGTVGLPSSARSSVEVKVDVPLVAGQALTDQADELAYGAGAFVESASGVLASEVPGPAYPTISARQAVGVLRADHGFVFYGGIAPIETGTPAEAMNGYSTLHASGYGDELNGPPPVIRVVIDHAILQYATYVLANGTSWLLPTWSLSGAEHGAGVAHGARYSAYVLAVAPQYVRLEAGSSNP
jgi:hypothetical protein